MSKSWSTSAAAYLVDSSVCPRCDARLRGDGPCYNCRADLSSVVAAEVHSASHKAAAAIALRQGLIDTLATVAAPQPAFEPVARLAPQVRIDREGSGSQVSVQSILAVAGAALFAVAAIIFTFLNPDLSDFATRTAIVAGVTAAFLAGAWLLSRARLSFSAEAIGALGMVFLGLDVWAFSTNEFPGVDSWALVGVGTVVAALAMLFLAAFVRLRTWLWLALVGLAAAPVFFGIAVGGVWGPVVGDFAVAVVALAEHDLIAQVGRRFVRPLVADSVTATVIQVLFMGVVLTRLPFTPGLSAIGSSGILLALAILAALSTRNRLAPLWSVLAGAFLASAAAISSLSLPPGIASSPWLLGLIPLFATVGGAICGLLVRFAPRRVATGPRGFGGLRPAHALVGAAAVAVACALPAVGESLVLAVTVLWRSEASEHALAAVLGLAATSGIALFVASQAGTLGMSAAAARRTSEASGAVFVAFASLTVVALAGWTTLPPVAQAAISIGVAALLGLALTRLRLVRGASNAAKITAVVAIHVLLVFGAVICWGQPILSVIGGTVVVATVVIAAQTIPRRARPLHAGVGYAYALVVLAHALSLAHLDTIAVLCITTAAGSLFAIAVTLVRRLSVGFWYAVLIVTMIPFIGGIIEVLFVRSGWTALSTGVTFALALTLVMSRRPGLNRYLRAAAAALLVPALAVVVVCLGAQVILASASPITLPIIAVIVACVLPSTGLIGAALERLGLPHHDVRIATLCIEGSALLTGTIAVVVALVRAAAGLNTSFIVLVIIGIGAAVTGITTKRRYAWAVAGASWTGALWCFWALVGVSVLEPYVLPPAIAAAAIGAISVARRLPGTALYSVGLACAAVPTVAVLIATGNGSGPILWRTWGLLAGSLLLLALARSVSRRGAGTTARRLRALRLPTLIVAMVSASAGTIQAVRFGVNADPTTVHPVMIPALLFSAAAAALAAVGGVFLFHEGRLARARWLLAPALVYLAAGPIASIRHDWLSIWALWGLMTALCALMLVITVRRRNSDVARTPVWFVFLLAWCTGVAAWSPRQLRVEAFSLVLGLALLAVGVISLRSRRESMPTIGSWPSGFQGSWALLAPGLVATFLPSMLATGTDPQTLRAILVIGLALIAILIGSLRKLAAPFLLGIIVLPVENITVFAVQVGHSIGAAPWWITLATAGAVLLVVAVTYERRDSGDRSVSARLRDLR